VRYAGLLRAAAAEPNAREAFGKSTAESLSGQGLNNAMKTSPLDREIRSRIDTLLTDISALVKNAALESVHAALGGISGGGAPAAGLRRGPGRPRKDASASAAPKAARPGKRAKRSSEDVIATANSFLAYVKTNPGQSVEQIGKALGVSTKELQLPVIKLVQARALQRTTADHDHGTKSAVTLMKVSPSELQWSRGYG
jgi:hypothetical protein